VFFFFFEILQITCLQETALTLHLNLFKFTVVGT